MTSSTRTPTAAFVSLALVVAMATIPASPAIAGICSNSFLPGLIALPDLASATYFGQKGGLYPGGSNSIPTAHASLGMSLANQVQPRDAGGNINPAGKIGLVAIGVSNTSDDFGAFTELAAADTRIASEVVLIDGGLSSQPIDSWLATAGGPWTVLSDRLSAANVSDLQVQVAWVMLPDRDLLPDPFPQQQQSYREKLQTVLRSLGSRFPNLVLAYLSSHSYTGYAVDHPNVEPIGYEHGFGVKWVIENQINGAGNINANPALGEVAAPWVAWGPYLWANGLGPDQVPGGQPGRADGLEWECSDFGSDGIHPSVSGRAKAAAALLDHFTSAPTACPWFLTEGTVCGAGATPPIFGDIAGSPFMADILWLSQENITQGCKPPPGALFCPTGLLTRGEMAAFLVRAAGYTDDGGGDLFVDDDGSIFQADIDKLATADVTNGCQGPPNPMFCPNELVSRGEMAAFLARALNLRSSPVDSFVDDDAYLFEGEIDSVAAAGITLGCTPPPDPRFCPHTLVTREQMAAFLHRAFG